MIDGSAHHAAHEHRHDPLRHRRRRALARPPGPARLPTVPADPVVAISDGEIVAAISARDGAVIADPFVHTAETVALLRRRARQLNTTTRLRRLTLRPAL